MSQRDIDYEKIGLKVGIEIHQQIDSSQKLFCNCPNQISDDISEISFTRKLRATQSEMGEVDKAAQFEFEKGRFGNRLFFSFRHYITIGGPRRSKLLYDVYRPDILRNINSPP